MPKARRGGGKRQRKRKSAIEVGQNPRRKRKRRKVASNVVQPIIGRGTARFGKRRKPRWKEAQVQLVQSPSMRVTGSFFQ